MSDEITPIEALAHRNAVRARTVKALHLFALENGRAVYLSRLDPEYGSVFELRDTDSWIKTGQLDAEDAKRAECDVVTKRAHLKPQWFHCPEHPSMDGPINSFVAQLWKLAAESLPASEVSSQALGFTMVNADLVVSGILRGLAEGKTVSHCIVDVRRLINRMTSGPDGAGSAASMNDLSDLVAKMSDAYKDIQVSNTVSIEP